MNTYFRWSCLCLVIGCLVLTGCVDPVAQVVEEHRAAAEVKLAELELLQKQVSLLAPLEASTEVGQVRLHIQQSSDEAFGNATVIYAADLDLLTASDTPYYSSPSYFTPDLHERNEFVADSILALRSDPQAFRFDVLADEALTRLESLQYVIVVRPRELREPVLHAWAGQPGSNTRTATPNFFGTEPASASGDFTAGNVALEALVFELSEARFLGGWIVTATNSDSIDFEYELSRGAHDAMVLALRRDLQENTRTALYTELARRMPGSIH